jgi:hypothetical protein
MVIYLSADGKAGYQQVDDLVAAVAFVERVRNTQGIENSRIYRMEQVNYRFEPYYQVRLETGELLGGPYSADASTEPGGSWQATGGPAAATAGAPRPAGDALGASASPAAGVATTSTGTAGAAAGSSGPGVGAVAGTGAAASGTSALGDPAPSPEPDNGRGARRGLLR